MKSSLNIKEILKKYHSIEIELLLSHVLGKPKEFLYMESARRLSASQLTSLQKLIRRREKGEPVAYILGYKDFMGLRFKVNEDVLIPRPETEWLVEKVAEHLLLFKEEYSAKQREVVGVPMPRVLDLGTGSGCIAIALKKVSKVTFDTYASDISQKALKVARENAKQHKVKIKFIHSDILENVRMSFDVIVANLPYVPIRMLNKYVLKQKLEPAHPFSGLRFEPLSALTDGTHSFQIYRRFFEQVAGHLNGGALILLEIDPSSRKFLVGYQKKYLPTASIKFYKDFNKFWRYAEIKTC